MSELEDQIRTAIRGRAGEIGGADIPPLRLPATRTSRRRRGTRRWLAPAAAAAAVLAVTGVVVAAVGAGGPAAAPGHPAAGRHSRAARPRPAAPGLISLRPAPLRRAVLGQYLSATTGQYAAGQQLQGAMLALEKADEARCVARAGVKARLVPALPLARMAARYAAQFFDNSQFPGLALIARTRSFGPALPFVVALRPAAGQQAAFRRVSGRCSAAALAIFAPLEAAGQRLEDSWAPTLQRAQAAPPVLATLGRLRTCAARSGWPASPYGPPATAIKSFSDFGDWVFGHLDGADSRGASPAALRRLARHWTGVFVTCARPVMAAQNRWLAARQAAWLRRHPAAAAAGVTAARRALRRAQAAAG
jgi:hypothetical protein